MAKQWASHGLAADFRAPWSFGPVAAAFGPVEAQGRGSLHPHILVWLLLAPLWGLLDLLLRDKDSFRERVRLWMKQVIAAALATQESAVTELARQMQGGQNPADVQIPPLPFGPNERNKFRADGGDETAAAVECGLEETVEDQPLYFYDPTQLDEGVWKPAVRAHLPLRNRSGEVVDDAAWKTQFEEEHQGMWSRSVSTWPSGSFPPYRLGLEQLPSTAEGHLQPSEVLRRAMPSEEWLRNLCHDARDLVIGCAIHTCSPSCWKYHSKGASHICRHGFYHVVTFLTEDWTEIRRRRGGKPLRGCIGIFRETQYGMAGRILTYQVNPNECPTHYASLVGMRCNVDVQDMRRVLPPKL